MMDTFLFAEMKRPSYFDRVFILKEVREERKRSDGRCRMEGTPKSLSEALKALDDHGGNGERTNWPHYD
jgi:hypothetical protein